MFRKIGDFRKCLFLVFGFIFLLAIGAQAEEKAKIHLTISGPPGAGKSTMGGILSEKYHIPMISVGSMLRGEINKDTPLGRMVKPFVESGNLCPPELIRQVVESRLSEPDCAGGFILDGYPRQMADMDNFLKITEKMGIKDFFMIGIHVTPEVLIERLKYRRVCQNGHSWDLSRQKPKKEGICDICGTPLRERNDDKPEIIRHRVEVYDSETMPVINKFREMGRYFQVESGGIEEITSAMSKIIDEHLENLKKCR